MAELWLFVWLMVMGKTFPSHLEVLLARTTSSKEPKNYTILTTILQFAILHNFTILHSDRNILIEWRVLLLWQFVSEACAKPIYWRLGFEGLIKLIMVCLAQLENFSQDQKSSSDLWVWLIDKFSPNICSPSKSTYQKIVKSKKHNLVADLQPQGNPL